MATTVPTANGIPLDQFNDALRASPAWQSFIRQNGFLPNGPVKLSGNQREALKRQLQNAGIAFPKGMEIDPAGNVNQDQGVSKVLGNKYVQIGLIAGASLATMGAAGLGPLAGVMGGASTAAGAGAGVAVGAGVGAGTGTAAAAGLSSWLTPALAYGVPAATGLIGATIQANAERDAAGLQTDYLNRALDVEKENQQYQRGQRADYLGRLAPYNQAGTAAVGRASDLLTTSRYRPEGTMSGAPVGGGMVALKDSQGVVRQVPAAEADRYLQMGAVRA